MERIEHIDSKEFKGQKTITIHLKGGNEPRLMLSPQVRLYIYSLRTSLSSLRVCMYWICFYFVPCISCKCLMEEYFIG